MANVLFVCLHNAGRSQMSQALFAITANGRHQAKSAGTRPGERVHPQVVEAMRELGVDVSDRKPRALDMELAQWADVVVTMGCGDQCPYIPGRPTSTGACPTPRTSRASRSAESATTSKTASRARRQARRSDTQLELFLRPIPGVGVPGTLGKARRP